MILTLVDITYISKGVWGLVYTATCSCGCKLTRHIAIYKGRKPSLNQANQAIDADYNKG